MPRPRMTDEQYEQWMQSNSPTVATSKRLEAIARKAKRRTHAEAADERRGIRLPASRGLDLRDDSELDIAHGRVEVEDAYVLHGRRVGVISDVHVPFHDKYATEAALRWLKAKDIDTLVINGDFMDCYNISTHDKDPFRRTTLGEELEEGRTILAQIRSYFGRGVEIVYQEGNHEERFNKFLPREMASDKVRGSSLKEQLDLDIHGITWVGGRRGIDLGKLRIYHGHEMRASGVNAPRTLLTRAMDNVLVGHLHRPKAEERPDIRGNVRGAWVTGCLCNLRPHYAPSNEWSHGFAFIECDETGWFKVDPRTIQKGRVI